MCLTLCRLGIFLLLPVAYGLTTLRKTTSKPQQSITIPCMYDDKYQHNRKYLCQGYRWAECSIMAYAGQANRTVEVIDHPAQNIFTVTLRDMQPKDPGHYWCAVEIGGNLVLDDRAYFHVSVIEDPDLSVQRRCECSGGDVSVLCRYSARYRREKKRWCRLRDQRCSSVGGFRSPADPNEGWDPQMRDDGSGTLSVEMVGVKQTDSGWYWCEVGDLQIPVYLNITDESNVSTTGHLPKEALIGVSVTFGLLLLLAVIGAVAWREMNKQRADMNIPTPARHRAGSEVEYNSVFFKRRNNKYSLDQPHCSPVEDDHIIYSSVVN
ncbi:polymeric immunoglobulin receptor-like isoform X1 [Alosa sapidissima]|uniref:polymeric immunoglobulin receptor-like isoform X1 n=1 Tax=Alosa sapidissima TaxID=34773 RepID=UPI001C09FD70|nr:polymeric immunoglobulin receptor-like isoform X1 [Alosa sapidissima]